MYSAKKCKCTEHLLLYMVLTTTFAKAVLPACCTARLQQFLLLHRRN